MKLKNSTNQIKLKSNEKTNPQIQNFFAFFKNLSKKKPSEQYSMGSKKLKLQISPTRWKEEKEIEVESLEKRDTRLDSRRLQKVKRRSRTADRRFEEGNPPGTRWRANRRTDGSVSLSSIPARSLSPRGIPQRGRGGLLLAPGRLRVGQGVERSRRGTSHETVRE